MYPRIERHTSIYKFSTDNCRNKTELCLYDHSNKWSMSKSCLKIPEPYAHLLISSKCINGLYLHRRKTYFANMIFLCETKNTLNLQKPTRPDWWEHEVDESPREMVKDKEYDVESSWLKKRRKFSTQIVFSALNQFPWLLTSVPCQIFTACF